MTTCGILVAKKGGYLGVQGNNVFLGYYPHNEHVSTSWRVDCMCISKSSQGSDIHGCTVDSESDIIKLTIRDHNGRYLSVDDEGEVVLIDDKEYHDSNLKNHIWTQCSSDGIPFPVSERDLETLHTFNKHQSVNILCSFGIPCLLKGHWDQHLCLRNRNTLSCTEDICDSDNRAVTFVLVLVSAGSIPIIRNSLSSESMDHDYQNNTREIYISELIGNLVSREDGQISFNFKEQESFLVSELIECLVSGSSKTIISRFNNCEKNSHDSVIDKKKKDLTFHSSIQVFDQSLLHLAHRILESVSSLLSLKFSLSHLRSYSDGIPVSHSVKDECLASSFSSRSRTLRYFIRLLNDFYSSLPIRELVLRYEKRKLTLAELDFIIGSHRKEIQDLLTASSLAMQYSSGSLVKQLEKHFPDPTGFIFDLVRHLKALFQKQIINWINSSCIPSSEPLFPIEIIFPYLSESKGINFSSMYDTLKFVIRQDMFPYSMNHLIDKIAEAGYYGSLIKIFKYTNTNTIDNSFLYTSDLSVRQDEEIDIINVSRDVIGLSLQDSRFMDSVMRLWENNKKALTLLLYEDINLQFIFKSINTYICVQSTEWLYLLKDDLEHFPLWEEKGLNQVMVNTVFDSIRNKASTNSKDYLMNFRLCFEALKDTVNVNIDEDLDDQFVTTKTEDMNTSFPSNISMGFSILHPYSMLFGDEIYSSLRLISEIIMGSHRCYSLVNDILTSLIFSWKSQKSIKVLKTKVGGSQKVNSSDHHNSNEQSLSLNDLKGLHGISVHIILGLMRMRHFLEAFLRYTNLIGTITLHNTATNLIEFNDNYVFKISKESSSTGHSIYSIHRPFNSQFELFLQKISLNTLPNILNIVYDVCSQIKKVSRCNSSEASSEFRSFTSYASYSDIDINRDDCDEPVNVYHNVPPVQLEVHELIKSFDDMALVTVNQLMDSKESHWRLLSESLNWNSFFCFPSSLF